ncbi:hypothetical protein [Burkholderia gladioli]|uniref:hypothetical protein n=2 Tax=Burkholderia gladioli TaxID=28095 RepID=UPI00163F2011|nr:hypothetical protein [Burkholderia gladioli]
MPEISVGVPVPLGGFASVPQSDAEQDRLEPFGTVSPRDTAMSVTVVPLNLIVDQQAWIVNDTPRYPLVNLTDKDDYASVADGNIVGSPGANTAYRGTPRAFSSPPPPAPAR